MLFIDRKIGESLLIGPYVLRVSGIGRRDGEPEAAIAVDAPREVPVRPGEIGREEWERRKAERRG